MQLVVLLVKTYSSLFDLFELRNKCYFTVVRLLPSGDLATPLTEVTPQLEGSTFTFYGISVRKYLLTPAMWARVHQTEKCVSKQLRESWVSRTSPIRNRRRSWTRSHSRYRCFKGKPGPVAVLLPADIEPGPWRISIKQLSAAAQQLPELASTTLALPANLAKLAPQTHNPAGGHTSLTSSLTPEPTAGLMRCGLPTPGPGLWSALTLLSEGAC